MLERTKPNIRVWFSSSKSLRRFFESETLYPDLDNHIDYPEANAWKLLLTEVTVKEYCQNKKKESFWFRGDSHWGQKSQRTGVMKRAEEKEVVVEHQEAAMVVAVTDGVMPQAEVVDVGAMSQTQEVTSHVNDVPIAVAVDKCHKLAANPESVNKKQAEEEVDTGVMPSQTPEATSHVKAARPAANTESVNKTQAEEEVVVGVMPSQTLEELSHSKATFSRKENPLNMLMEVALSTQIETHEQGNRTRITRSMSKSTSQSKPSPCDPTTKARVWNKIVHTKSIEKLEIEFEDYKKKQAKDNFVMMRYLENIYTSLQDKESKSQTRN